MVRHRLPPLGAPPGRLRRAPCRASAHAAADARHERTLARRGGRARVSLTVLGDGHPDRGQPPLLKLRPDAS